MIEEELGQELRWHGRVLSKELTTVKIIVISDLHYGNPYASLHHFKKTIDFIECNADCFCFLNGDLLESVVKASKGDVYNQKLPPSKQRKHVAKILKPISHKILGMTTGNHEQRLTDLTSEDPSALIAESLGVPYRPEGMLFKLSFGDNNKSVVGKPFVFWSYITHGYGGARTKSAKAVKVERAGTWIPKCDFVAMSHDHVVNVAPDVDFVPDNRGKIDEETGFLSGKITAHRKMLVKTNAYLKWGGYAEFGGFPPTDLASPIISLLTPHSEQWADYPERRRQAVKVSV